MHLHRCKQIRFNPGSHGVKVIYSWRIGNNKGLRVASMGQGCGGTVLLSLTSHVKQPVVEPQCVRWRIEVTDFKQNLMALRCSK